MEELLDNENYKKDIIQKTTGIRSIVGPKGRKVRLSVTTHSGVVDDHRRSTDSTLETNTTIIVLLVSQDHPDVFN